MLKREDAGPVTILTQREEDLLADCASLHETCSGLVEQGRTQIVLDMEDVGCVTSVYLGALISIVRLLREHDGTLKMLHLQPAVSSFMEMSRLSRIIEIFNDRDAALKSFSD
ncbi:MAG: STAS domain-containing protein [bacterium]